MKKNVKILIVDDETEQLDILSSFFDEKGFNVKTADSGEAALTVLKSFTPLIVISDVKMRKISGVDLLKVIKEKYKNIEVVLITAHGDVKIAVEAIKLGATDFIIKPVNLKNLEQIVLNAIERSSINEISQPVISEDFSNNTSNIISNNKKMREILDYSRKAAVSNASVLIRGESGTGKELLANFVHKHSQRNNAPFVPVNCAALNENLLESELFGHKKGAFTGANEDRIGRFEEADSGTIFLDEIGDLPLATQVKLLRVIQEKEFQRVGENKTIKTNVRIICATHKNLERMILGNTFREDLYYRLNVISVSLPPLRERKDDIPLLIEHFLNRFAKETKSKYPIVSQEAINNLIEYDFKGNIRELENIILRSFVMRDDNNCINKFNLLEKNHKMADLLLNLEKNENGNNSLANIVDTVERLVVKDTLDRAKNNQTKAAEMLGLTERNLRYRLNKWK